MALPIGIKGRGPASFPWLTACLAALCAGLFAFDWSSREAADARIDAARSATLAYLEQRPYLDLDPASAERVFPGLDSDARTARLAQLRRSYRYRVVELQRAMDQPELDRLSAELAARVDDQLVLRFGFAPAKASATTWLTHMFLQRTPAEAAVTLVFLLLAGCLLESLWPRPLVPALFVASGLVCAAVLRALQPELSTPVVGAGGALAGLMGAIAVRFCTSQLQLGGLAVPALLLPVLALASDLFALPALQVGAPASQFTHLAGFALGALVALCPRLLGMERAVARPPARARPAQPTEQTLDSVPLRRMVQEGSLDRALAKLASIDGDLEAEVPDVLLLVALGSKLIKAGRGSDGAGVLSRALAVDGSALPAAVALRVARELTPVNSGLAARAARCGLADPKLDASLRDPLESLAGSGPAASPGPWLGEDEPGESEAPAAPAVPAESPAPDHGVVDLAPLDDDESLELGADGGESGEFDVNDLGQSFDFDDEDEEGGAGFLQDADLDKDD